MYVHLGLIVLICSHGIVSLKANVEEPTVVGYYSFKNFLIINEDIIAILLLIIVRSDFLYIL